MINNNVKTASNCCNKANVYDFVLGVLWDLDILTCFDDYVIRIRTKYNEEDDWSYDNVLLLADGWADIYKWRNDWWAGQKYVEVLGAVRVYDVLIPDFETK